jgi:hypothetical protein
VNSPGNVTLSGNATEIDEIVASMKEKGIFAQVRLFLYPYCRTERNKEEKAKEEEEEETEEREEILSPRTYLITNSFPSF